MTWHEVKAVGDIREVKREEGVVTVWFERGLDIETAYPLSLTDAAANALAGRILAALEEGTG